MVIQKSIMPVIVLPAQATTREQYAAETLQRYLQQIFGTGTAVQTDEQTAEGAKILLGGPERKHYEDIKLYTIPERGELLYMQRHFDTYQGNDGFGICIPVTGEDNGFDPDQWYQFEGFKN